MSDDKIAEIRANHAQSDGNYVELESKWDIHADRATLLAEDARHRTEIERLRAEVGRLQAVVATLEIVGKAADDERQTMRERIEQLHEIIENNGVPCVIRRLL